MNELPVFDILLIALVPIFIGLLTLAVLVVRESRRMRQMLDLLEDRAPKRKRAGFWARVWNR